MHDIRAIREEPDLYDKNWARRGAEPQSKRILEMDAELRAVKTELQDLQHKRNEKSQKIGEIKREGGDAQAIMDEVGAIKNSMTELEEQERTLADSLSQHLAGLPNLLTDDVPDGKSEDDNKELRVVGEPKRANEEPKDHADIGADLGMMDFETAAQMSGSRFVVLKHGLARLERALAQFMLDIHTQEHGYTEVSPPLLVRDNALYGTGQLPKFAEDLFKTDYVDYDLAKRITEEVVDELLKEAEGSFSKLSVIAKFHDIYQKAVGKTSSSRWLIPTAEVSLTNMVADQILDADELPLRYTAFTPCFRSEAGAAGKDTRGMIRQHQFYKVEMVSIVEPDKSWDELDRMTECAETVLKKLDLPFRTMILCSGDTGFGARKTHDIEVWLPGQGAYREISSCSNCGDFQARRMMARFREKGEKQTQFLHTLNGSGVAVGRALIAVLENYYDPADGGVFIPEVLRQYMNGETKIEPVRGGKSGREAAA